MLRSQINPHFLYNTLENMRMSAYTQGYTDLSEMCFLLSKVLRYGVSEQDKLVTVREELEQLKNYTDLLHYCLPALQIFVFVDDQIMDYSIIKVILQPLVKTASTTLPVLRIQRLRFRSGDMQMKIILYLPFLITVTVLRKLIYRN